MNSQTSSSANLVIADHKLSDLVAKARQVLGTISYESEDIGYYVVMNGHDLGEQDYCQDCIKAAVRKARDTHRERRQEIIDSHNAILNQGFIKLGKERITVTRAQVVSSKRSKLKEFPAKAAFTYLGHDPDFGGGLREPKCCEDCGKFFTCSFNPDEEEANHLLTQVNQLDQPLDEANKWEIDQALEAHEYWDDEVKPIMLEVVNKLLVRGPIS